MQNWNTAYVRREKLTEYLLSETHPDGKWKAAFFGAMGYTLLNVDVLEQGLLDVARAQRVVDVWITNYGTKYLIEGILETPTGRSVRIATVWIVELSDLRPRFVTAYPARNSNGIKY